MSCDISSPMILSVKSSLKEKEIKIKIYIIKPSKNLDLDLQTTMNNKLHMGQIKKEALNDNKVPIQSI